MKSIKESLFHFVSLFLTRRCDLACSYCGIAGKEYNKKEDLPLDVWREIIKRWSPITWYFNILGGEPTLYKDLPKVIQCLSMGGSNFGLTSDGRMSVEDYVSYSDLGLGELSVSIDSLGYRYSCKSSRMKSERNLRLITHPDIEATNMVRLVGTVVTKDNINEIPAMARFFKEKGIYFAPCIVQDSPTFGENVSIYPDQDDINELVEWVSNGGREFLADHVDYYKLWGNPYPQWHCGSKMRAPAIDYDGRVWSCYGNKGSLFCSALEDDFDKIIKSCIIDMKSCKGCIWNCLWTSNAIAEERLTMGSWV